jgi:hypothetical protein
MMLSETVYSNEIILEKNNMFVHCLENRLLENKDLWFAFTC